MSELPTHTILDKFYIWFDFNNKKEYYATPLFLVNTTREYIDPNNITIKINSDMTKYKLTKEEVLKHPSFISIHYTESCGMCLIRFLNADFSTFKTAYNTFLYAYGFEFLSMYSSLVFKDRYANEKDFIKDARIFYEHAKYKLLPIQEAFRNCVNFVYNLDGNDKYTDSSYSSKLIAYIIKDATFYTFAKNLEVILEDCVNIHNLHRSKSMDELLSELNSENSNITLKNYYTSSDIRSLCYAVLSELTKYENLPIKKCQNCGRYFIPTVRQTEIYCDLENVDGKPTCREQGASLTYKKNLQKVPALAAYRQIYQKKVMAVYRNPDDIKQKKAFDKWKKQAQLKIKQFKKGQITEDILDKWIKENS